MQFKSIVRYVRGLEWNKCTASILDEKVLSFDRFAGRLALKGIAWLMTPLTAAALVPRLAKKLFPPFPSRNDFSRDGISLDTRLVQREIRRILRSGDVCLERGDVFRDPKLGVLCFKEDALKIIVAHMHESSRSAIERYIQARVGRELAEQEPSLGTATSAAGPDASAACLQT